ncbi:MAG: hypothetical protein HC932_04885 [Thermales bacterium]|nr:hypothetical protein [Thermales bacterium]
MVCNITSKNVPYAASFGLLAGFNKYFHKLFPPRRNHQPSHPIYRPVLMQLDSIHHHLRQDLAVADQVQVVSLAAAEAGEKFIHSLRKYTGYTTLHVRETYQIGNSVVDLICTAV